MELEELWRTLRDAVWGSKWLILTLCVTATLTGIALSFIIPEKYRSSALVLVRPEETLGLSSTPAADKEVLDLPASGSTLQVETPSKTYIEVIKSRAVAERIVGSLGLHLDTEEPDGGLVGTLKTWVKSSIVATRDYLKYGRTIEIDPFEKAVQELLRNISLTAVRDTFVFEITYLAGDPEQAAGVANAAAEVFVEFRSRDADRDARSHREFVETQLRETEAGLLEARNELRAFKERNRTASFAEERSEQIKAIAALEVRLEETEVELAGMLREFTASNPKVMMVQGRKERLEETIAEGRERLARLPGQESALASLELRVRTLEREYEFLKTRFEEARFSESRQRSEIRVVSPATVPVYPVKPIKGYYGAVAFVLAFFVSLGMALIIELTDTRVRTIEDAERVLDLPVLGTTPEWTR